MPKDFGRFHDDCSRRSCSPCSPCGHEHECRDNRHGCDDHRDGRHDRDDHRDDRRDRDDRWRW